MTFCSVRGRSTARLVFVACVVLAAAGAVSAAESSSLHRRAVEVEGVVRAAITSCDASGCHTFLRTVTQEGGPSQAVVGDDEAVGAIWVVEEASSAEAAGRSAVRRLVSDLPRSAGGMTVCREPTGTASSSGPSLMYQSGGSVFFVDPTSAEAPRAVRVGSASWSAPASAWSSDCGELFLVGDGRARFVRLAGAGTRRSLLSSTDFVLPTEVRRNPSGLTLETPRVRRLDTATNRIVIGPRSYDNLRLESVLFEPTPEVREWLQGGGSRDIEPPDESLDVLQAWSRLPAPEEVVESTYLVLHGRPVLVVVSKEADKVGLLERKKLRLFELAGDRSRTGRRPFFETLTSSRLWQKLDIEWVDLDRDGLDDLVLLQPEGLGGEALLVDAYLATGPLTLSNKPRRSRLKTDQSAWTLRHDWTGDGLPDVLVQDAGFVQIYEARETSSRRVRRSASLEWAETPGHSFALADPEVSGDDVSIRRRMWVDDWSVVVASSAEPAEDGADERGGVPPARSVVEIFRPVAELVSASSRGSAETSTTGSGRR